MRCARKEFLKCSTRAQKVVAARCMTTRHRRIIRMVVESTESHTEEIQCAYTYGGIMDSGCGRRRGSRIKSRVILLIIIVIVNNTDVQDCCYVRGMCCSRGWMKRSPAAAEPREQVTILFGAAQADFLTCYLYFCWIRGEDKAADPPSSSSSPYIIQRGGKRREREAARQDSWTYRARAHHSGRADAFFSYFFFFCVCWGPPSKRRNSTTAMSRSHLSSGCVWFNAREPSSKSWRKRDRRRVEREMKRSGWGARYTLDRALDEEPVAGSGSINAAGVYNTHRHPRQQRAAAAAASFTTHSNQVMIFSLFLSLFVLCSRLVLSL